MPNDFRRRWATPLLMLLGILALILLILFSIAFMLLALPPTIATIIALLLAVYVLIIGGVISKYRRQVTSRALGAGLVIGLVALFAAGVVGAQAGIYHEPEDDAPDEPGDEPAAEVPGDAFTFVAFDLGFDDPPTTIPAGEVTIAIDNTGSLPHDVTIDGVGTVVEAQGGQQDSATITLEAGEYRFWCDVPGHEPQMNGTFVVE